MLRVNKKPIVRSFYIMIIVSVFLQTWSLAGNELINSDLKLFQSNEDYPLDYDDDDHEDELEEIKSGVFLVLIVSVTSTYWLPIAYIDDGLFRYQNYPFEKNDSFLSESGRTWMMNYSLSTQYLDKDVKGWLFKSSISYLRLAVEPFYRLYQKDDDNSDLLSYGGQVLITFAQNHLFCFRSGFGYNHFENQSKHDGINLEYEASIYRKNLHFKLDYTLTGYTSTNNKEFQYNNDFKTSIGYFYKRLEFDLGYRWSTFDKEYLNKPEMGIIVWF